MPDFVNHPPHYTNGTIECIEAIEAALTPEEFRGYLKGNAMKYIWRERHKGGNESMDKARWYVQRLLATAAGDTVSAHLKTEAGSNVAPASKTPPCVAYDRDCYMYGELGANTSIGYGGTD